jgi:hypothetical protein
MRRALCVMALLCMGAASATPAQQDPVNLRCGDDRLQMDLAQRKTAFRTWARPINARNGTGNGAAFVGYLGSTQFLRLPFPVTPAGTSSTPGSADEKATTHLNKARALQKNEDMGLNLWIRLYYLHENNPQLPARIRADIKDALTKFQYWIDEPLNPPGYPPRTIQTQEFWSENHQAMFGTLEFLAGQKFPDIIFRDGRTGAQHRDKARARLLRWFDERMVFGFSEWNSPGYYEYEILPMLNLVDFSADPFIAKRAAMVLDLLFFDLARFSHRGSFGVTAGRAYGSWKSSGWSQSVGDVIEILFGTRGKFTWSDSPAGHALATTTRYCVPSVLIAIGRDMPERFVDISRASINPGDPAAPGMQTDEDALSWWSRSAYLLGPMRAKTEQMWRKWQLTPWLGEDLAKYAVPLQGTGIANEFFEGMSLTRANLYTYRDSGAMLSSVQQFRPGQMGAQINSWQVTVDNDVTVWGNYPRADGGGDGPNWWTGSWVQPFVFQQESAAIAVYAPDPISLQNIAGGSRTHLWFPFAVNTFDRARNPEVEGFENSGPGRFDRWRFEPTSSGGTWMFGARRTPEGEAYVGVFSARPCTHSTTGVWAGKEIECDGLRNAFIIQVGSSRTFGSFERFMAGCRNARIHLGTGLAAPMNPFVDVQVSYDSPDPVMTARGNHRMEVHYDKKQARYGGKVVYLAEYPRFRNPYVNASWGQKRYTIALGGLSLTHDRIDNVREGTGLSAPPFSAPFSNRYLYEGDIYGVRPDGQLVWRRHAVSVDRSGPPEGSGPTGVPIGPNGVTPSQTFQQAPTSAALRAAQQRATPRSQVQIQGQATNSRVLEAARTPAPRTPQSGTLNPSEPVPTPPPRIALPPASITQYTIGPTVAGSGWQNFSAIVPAGGGAAGATFYGVTPTGDLQWFLHEGSQDGAPRWRGPVTVGIGGWNHFKRFVPAGDGVIYAVGPDGVLNWYKHYDAVNAATPPRWNGPKAVGTGWGNNIVHAFAMERGVLYFVTADGSLYWNQHMGYRDGSNQWRGPTLVGSKWAGLKRVFSPGTGVIYAQQTNGDLLWYRHEGWEDGSMKWLDPIKVGDGYGEFTHVFVRVTGPPPVIN